MHYLNFLCLLQFKLIYTYISLISLPLFHTVSCETRNKLYTFLCHFFAAKMLSPVISLNMTWGFISYTIRHNQASIFHHSSDLTNTTAHPVKNLSHITQSRLIHTIYFHHFLKYIISTSSFKIFVGLTKSGSDWQ